MRHIGNTFTWVVLLGTLIFLAVFLNGTSRLTFAAPAGAAPAGPHPHPPDASSLPAEVLISPEDLAKILQSSQGEKPLLIHVGFHMLYVQAHIPGSEYIGPASQEDVLDKLRKRVESLPRGKFIVLYCGCCPWVNCPTVNPAYEALHGKGFTKVKVLYIPNNFGRDWLFKGYPVAKGE